MAEQDIIDEFHTNSVASLYDPMPSIPDRVSSPYYSFELKALALLDRASVKASSADTVPPEVWAAEHAVIQGALARFADTLEPLREVTTAQDGTTISFVHSTSWVSSVMVRNLTWRVSVNVYAATCALHMPYIRQWTHIESQTASRNHIRSICREAASTAAALLRQLRNVHVTGIPVWQGVSLTFFLVSIPLSCSSCTLAHPLQFTASCHGAGRCNATRLILSHFILALNATERPLPLSSIRTLPEHSANHGVYFD